MAFFAWSDAFHNKQVIIYTDNMPLVYIWSRGSRNARVMRLVRALFMRTASFNANLVLRHIPGHNNTSADLLSRFQIHQFFNLNPTADEAPSPIPQDVWQL